MSWIDWHFRSIYNKADPNDQLAVYEEQLEQRNADILRMQRIKEADMLLEEIMIRKNTTTEDSRLIPPDYDEVIEFRITNPLLQEQDTIIGILDDSNSTLVQQNELENFGERLKKTHGRPQKRTQIPTRTRLLLVKTRGGICEECKEALFQQIHHINGDPTDHDLSNLALVCYECHKKVEREKRLKKRALNKSLLVVENT